MKKLFAFLVAISMVAGIVPMMAYADVVTLDTLIGNELTNGTFEAGIDGWTASDGAAIASDITTTNNNSAKSMKITSAGTVTSSVNLYKQELYDVSLWVKPVSESLKVTVKVGTETVIDEVSVSSASNLTSKLRISGDVKSGVTLENANYNVDYDLVITVDGACFVDDVIVKESEEKIVNAVSNDDLGDWKKADSSTGTLSFEEVETTGESALKLTSTRYANAVQYIAVKKGATYTVTADVYLVHTTATTNAMYLYWSPTDKQNIKLNELEANAWKTVTRTITNNYPSTGENGDMAGVYFSLGGSVSSTFYLRNVSVKEEKSSSYNAPSVTLTAEKAATVVPVVTPTVDDGDSAYYMYRYSLNGAPVETGFAATVPSYNVGDDFEGTLTLDVKPVNSQGTFGDKKSVTLTYEEAVVVNYGIDDFDSALRNKIVKGTFENGMPEWTLSGLTMTSDIENVAENSFTSAKLAGNGTVTINPTIYYNELYDAELYVKPVSGDVEVSLVADFGNNLTHTVFSETVSVGAWTKLTGNVLRFKGSYKNGAAETVSPVLTLTVSGDCYIDEFTLTPATNLLLSESGIRIQGANDYEDVGGWTARGDSELTKTADGIKGVGLYGANINAAQYVVLEKNAKYTLNTEVMAVEESTNTSGMIYAGFTLSKPTFTLTNTWQELNYTINPASLTSDVIASSIMFSGADEARKADMYIRNASLVKELNYTAPVATVTIDSVAVQGDNVAGTAAVTIAEGDAAGYKYCYKLDGVTVKAGYASGDSIPAVTVPAPAGNTGNLTLTLIPVNSEGTYGNAVTSSVCTVSRYFVADVTDIPASSIAGGNTVPVAVRVSNNSDGPQTIAVIAAYYENNAMINCDIVQQEITSGNYKDYDLSVALPGNIGGNGVFNVFIWKGYNGNVFSMEPVSPVSNPVK